MRNTDCKGSVLLATLSRQLFSLYSLTKGKEDVLHLGKFFFLSFPHVFQILGTIAALSPVAGVHPIGWLVFLFFSSPLSFLNGGGGI